MDKPTPVSDTYTTKRIALATSSPSPPPVAAPEQKDKKATSSHATRVPLPSAVQEVGRRHNWIDVSKIPKTLSRTLYTPKNNWTKPIA